MYQGTLPGGNFEDIFVELDKNFHVKDIEVGKDHIIAVSKHNEVYVLGSNSRG